MFFLHFVTFYIQYMVIFTLYGPTSLDNQFYSDHLTKNLTMLESNPGELRPKLGA